MKHLILTLALLLVHQVALPVTLHRNDVFEMTSLAYLLSFDENEQIQSQGDYMPIVRGLKYQAIADEDLRESVRERITPFAGHDFVKFLSSKDNDSRYFLSELFDITRSLVVENGTITLKQGADIDRLIDNPLLGSRDALDNYIRLASSFYAATDFKGFLNENASYYDKCEELSNREYKCLDNTYFDRLLENGGKVEFIPVYSIYFANSFVGDWHDGMTVVISGFTETDEECQDIDSRSSSSLAKQLCESYAAFVYDENSGSVDKASAEFFNKLKAKDLKKENGTVVSKGGKTGGMYMDIVRYGTHQELTKSWMSWVYLFDYIEKSGTMTDRKDDYLHYAVDRDGIYWLEASLPKVIGKNADTDDVTGNMFAFCKAMSENFDSVVTPCLPKVK